MDFFTEYIVKKKKSPLVVLAALGMAALTIFIWIITLPLFFTQALSGIILLIDVGAVYFSYIVISSFNVEFEYIATNTDLDIDKIINRRKRKRLISIKLGEIEIMAPVGNASHKHTENKHYSKIIMAAKSVDDPDAYYIALNKNGESIKIIFNPTEKILDYAKRFYPEKIITK